MLGCYEQVVMSNLIRFLSLFEHNDDLERTMLNKALGSLLH